MELNDQFFSLPAEDVASDSLRGLFAAPSVRRKVEETARRHLLLPAERQALFEAVREVFLGKIEDFDLAPALLDRSGLPFEKGLAVQADLHDELFSDIADDLESQREFYVDFHPEEFLPPDPGRRDAVRELAEEAVSGSGLAPDDSRLKERMVAMAESRIRDVRDSEEFRAQSVRPAKTGGLGLSEDQAAVLLAAVEAAVSLRDSRIRGLEEERERWQEKAAAAEAAREARLRMMSPGGPEDAGAASVPEPTAEEMLEDRQEIEEALASVPDAGPEPAAALAEAVRAAADECGLTLPNEDLKRRFLTAVEMLFRDLRDGIETAGKMMQPVSAGGLGMSGPESERVTAVLERRLKEYRQSISGTVREEMGRFVAERQARTANESTDREAKEAEMRNRLFARLTGQDVPSAAAASAAVPPPVSPPAMPAMVPVRPPPASPPKSIPVMAADSKPKPDVMERDIAAKKEAAGQIRTQPLPGRAISGTPERLSIGSPQAAPDSSAPVRQAAPPPNLPAAEAVPPRPAPAVRPTPPPAVSAPAAKAPLPQFLPKPPAPAVPIVPAAKAKTVPLAAPSAEGKRMVADVLFSQKPIGPVEELKSISLADFRRLSKDPKEAIIKVKDKIDLLSDQSFETRAEGIRAWKDSETNRLYLTMLRDSLEGRPVSEVIREAEASGKPTLSKPEFDAVMELNRRLRFD